MSVIHETIINASFKNEIEFNMFIDKLCTTTPIGTNEVKFNKLIPIPESYNKIKYNDREIMEAILFFGYASYGKDTLALETPYLYLERIKSHAILAFSARDLSLMGLNTHATLGDVVNWLEVNLKNAPNEEVASMLQKHRVSRLYKIFKKTKENFDIHGYWTVTDWCVNHWGTPREPFFNSVTTSVNEVTGEYNCRIELQTEWYPPEPILIALHEKTKTNFHGYFTCEDEDDYNYWFEDGNYFVESIEETN